MLLADTLAFAVKHHRAGNLQQAEGMYRQVLREEPNHPEALHLLGVLAKQTGRVDLALQSISRALSLNTNRPAFHFSLATALRQRGQLDQAISHFQRAVEMDPEFADAHMQLGVAWQELGQLTKALSSFDRGLALRPHDWQARLLRGMISLAMGDFSHGWPEFEWRWANEQGTAFPNCSIPVWEGSSLLGKSLLVQAERNLSDQIMFASCLPELIARARQCVVECDPRLATLFARSFPTATIATVGRDSAATEAQTEIDLRIAAGSVPRYLRLTFESFPRSNAFLVADAHLRQMMWSGLEALGPGMKVGIAWRGGREGTTEGRSTSLREWRRLLQLPGLHFVSLQSGNRAAELRQFRSECGTHIHVWPEALHPADLDSTAALISALDLVIAVPSSIAHLAGALGIETWNLLTHWSSWRWFLHRDDSPWYPRMRLFRQSQPGRWDAVFERLEKALSARTESMATIAP